MLTHLLIGSAMIFVSIIIMAAFVGVAISFLEKSSKWLGVGKHPIRFTVAVSASTLWLLFSLTITVWLWAGLFLLLGQFNCWEEAVYFSVVSFTTLGYGDIVIGQEWRILSGLIAANGLILFSLTTAFLIELIRRLAVSLSPDSDR